MTTSETDVYKQVSLDANKEVKQQRKTHSPCTLAVHCL